MTIRDVGACVEDRGAGPSPRAAPPPRMWPGPPSASQRSRRPAKSTMRPGGSGSPRADAAGRGRPHGAGAGSLPRWRPCSHRPRGRARSGRKGEGACAQPWRNSSPRRWRRFRATRCLVPTRAAGKGFAWQPCRTCQVQAATSCSRLEVQIRQFAQPVGAVEIGPFRAQNRQALAFGADLALEPLHVAHRGLGDDGLVIGPITQADHGQCGEEDA
jgi:hypothetical protein